MSRPLVFGSAIALVMTVFVSALAGSALQTYRRVTPSSTLSPLTSSPISLWEAYAKGKASVEQVEVGPGDPSGYRVSNSGTVPVVVDEKVVLLSPHPLESTGGDTTQDGVLTEWTIPAGGSVTYNYALSVILGPANDPKWWCMEANQLVQAGVFVRLGGETLPFVLADMVDNWTKKSQTWDDNTQEDLWKYMELHPTLVIGKTPLWKSLPDLAGTAVDMTIAVTNMGVYDSNLSNGSAVRAVDSVVTDVIPDGFSYDPSSFSPTPTSITDNPDGSKTLTWKVTISGADVNGHDLLKPTPYHHVLLKYRLILPELTPDRHFLPRAKVDTNHDGVIDAHSAKPLLEIYHVNRPPVANAGGPYVVPEGTGVSFDASASYDPDSGPSNLTYRWDFENDGIWDTSWSSSPFASRTWGDDYKGTVAVEVSDANMTSKATASLTIINVLPSGSATILSAVQHEGSSIQFSAHVADPGSDDTFFTWSWGDGTPDSTSTYYNNGASPDPYPSPDIHPRDVTDVKTHTYGDNGAFTVKILVRDDDSGSIGTTVQITATPDNLPPSVSVTGGTSIYEGESVALTATATDPGSDDLTFAWSWGEGSTESRIYYNNGVSPDPFPSPGGTYPFTATDSATHPYGDNGVYTVTLTVTDDDDGSTTWSGQVTVVNLLPEICVFPPLTVNEGSLLSIDVCALDPGSDDLTFKWTFELGPTLEHVYYNDGVGPDPPQSPWGTYPFLVNDTVDQTYGDDGVYAVTLTVTDDDGGVASYTTTITVTNLPPAITPFGPFEVNEGDPIAALANAVDAGSDDLTFIWTFEYGPTATHVYFNDGIGPDPPMSPNGTFPFSVSDSAAHTYGDNGVFKLTLTVQDDDGGIATYETTVTVLNVPPTILDARAFILADITLRVAGEKWHDVILRLYEDGKEVGYAQVIRYPGSPDRQTATLHNVEITLNRRFSAVAYYTPDDDPINGQPNGANPAWLIISWENGMETRLHHTFNVQHPDTWVWTVDNLYIYAVNQRIHLKGTAFDPGSDDLTFTWDSGDGRTFTSTYYNNGVSPDPYPSPEVNPITATDEQVLTYGVAGTYTITLTVTDDDGGSATTSMTITMG